MNILIIGRLSRPQLGGVQELTHQLATHLTRHGHRVGVLGEPNPAAAESDRRVEYGVIRLNPSYKRWYRRWLWSPYVAWAILRAAAKQRTDIIVANSLWSWPHLCHRVARLRKVPFVVLVHGNDLGTVTSKSGDLHLRPLLAADAVVCNSSFVRSMVLKLGVNPARALTIPPGIDPNAFQFRPQVKSSSVTRALGLQEKRVILTLGRLVERKGHDQVIRAMARIRREIPNAVYLIAGDGKYARHLHTLVQEYHLEDAVTFAGSFSDGDCQAFYDTCDVFVMVSRQPLEYDVEGFGITYLEAGACGKPVVAGRSGGATEAVEDGVNGLLVDPLSESEIAEAVCRLLHDSSYAIKLGQQGRSRVENQFAWNRIAEKHCDALLELLGHPVAASKHQR